MLVGAVVGMVLSGFLAGTTPNTHRTAVCSVSPEEGRPLTCVGAVAVDSAQCLGGGGPCRCLPWVKVGFAFPFEALAAVVGVTRLPRGCRFRMRFAVLRSWARRKGWMRSSATAFFRIVLRGRGRLTRISSAHKPYLSVFCGFFPAWFWTIKTTLGNRFFSFNQSSAL